MAGPHPKLALRAPGRQLREMSSNALWIFLPLLLLNVTSVPAAESTPASTAAPAPPPAAPPLTPAQEYQNFLQQMVSAENLTDLVMKMDTVIDEADSADHPSQSAHNAARADTRNGFHLEFSVIHSPEAILYYAGISRKNDEMLKYKEATMLFALFCDRVGLTHPFHVSEGEKPVFHAQWLIKPSEWKVFRKKMLEVRAANRAEKNVFTAMTTAVTAEVNARVATTQSNTSGNRGR